MRTLSPIHFSGLIVGLGRKYKNGIVEIVDSFMS